MGRAKKIFKVKQLRPYKDGRNHFIVTKHGRKYGTMGFYFKKDAKHVADALNHNYESGIIK